MSVLQAHAEGVTIDDCVRTICSSSSASSALVGKVTRAAVEGVLVGLEESFMAYRGPGGAFKLL